MVRLRVPAKIAKVKRHQCRSVGMDLLNVMVVMAMGSNLEDTYNIIRIDIYLGII